MAVMGVRQQAGLASEHSRLKELDALAQLEFGDRERSLVETGFMVSPRLMPTTHHELARDARVMFDFEDGADFMILEGIPGDLRGPLRDALAAVDQVTIDLAAKALLRLDPAVTAKRCGLDGSQAEIAAGMYNNRPAPTAILTRHG